MRRIILLAAAMAAFSPALATAGTVTQNFGDPPLTQSEARTFRDGVASTCGAPKGYPGTFGAGPRQNKLVTMTNNGPARCVTVDVTSDCGVGIFVVAYDGVFDPLNKPANYLADIGSSNFPVTFSFDVAAGANVVFLLETVPDAVVPACSFTIDSAELDAPVAVPTLGEWAMIGLAGMLALGGAALVWLRRRETLDAA